MLSYVDYQAYTCSFHSVHAADLAVGVQRPDRTDATAPPGMCVRRTDHNPVKPVLLTEAEHMTVMYSTFCLNPAGALCKIELLPPLFPIRVELVKHPSTAWQTSTN